MSRTHRRLLLGFVAGTAGFLVLHAVRGGDDWGLWLALAPVVGAVVAVSSWLRGRAREAAFEAGQEQRRRDGLPVEEPRSIGDEYRDHPVRTVVLVIVLAAVFVGLFWLRAIS